MTREGLLPSDAREILERAMAYGSIPYQRFVEPEGTQKTDGHDQWVAVTHGQCAALELGAWLAAASHDPGLLPTVLRALRLWTELSGRIDGPSHVYHPFATAVRELLLRGAEVTDAVRALVDHPHLALRRALVEALEDQPREHVDLLQRLAADPSPHVRDKAKETLAGVAAPPWWTGVFPRDPVPLLSEEEARALGPTLARWAELRNADDDEEAELAALLEGLPDVLAADVLPRLVVDRALDLGLLAQRMVRIAGWPVIAARILGELEGYVGGLFGDALKKAPGAQDEATARAFLAAARARPVEERRSHVSVTRRLAQLAGDLWPTGCDAFDEFAAWLAEEGWNKPHLDAVDEAVVRWASSCPRCLERYREEVLEAWLTDPDADPWKRLWSFRQRVLDSLAGSELREAARRALASESPLVAGWGIDQVLGPAHDPERDPPLEAVLEGLLAEPRLLKLVATSRRAPAHAERLRGLLYEGRLDPSGALSVMAALAGPGNLLKDRWLVRNPPPPGATRLVPEDWAVFRRQRDASEIEHWHPFLFCLPVGPIAREDQAFLARALEVARAGGDDGRWAAEGLAHVYCECGTAADLPIVDELAGKYPQLDASHVEYRKRMRKRLGMDRPRRAPDAGGAGPAGEWMDEA